MFDLKPLEVKLPEIDRGVQSHAINVVGIETLESIGLLDVLLIGAKGAGTEIAKNLVIAGVHSLTIHDEELVEACDVGANFFLQNSDVGTRNRSSAVVPRLADLNSRVTVNSHTGTPVSASLLVEYDIVVCVDVPRARLLFFSEVCHQQAIAFVACESRGVAGYMFTDFGDGHRPLRECLVDPRGSFEPADEARPLRQEQLHMTFQGLAAFHEEHHHLPEVSNHEHAAEVARLAVEFNALNKEVQYRALAADAVDADVRHAAAGGVSGPEVGGGAWSGRALVVDSVDKELATTVGLYVGKRCCCPDGRSVLMPDSTLGQRPSQLS
jgi:molybdopterin/thiamine biosynthesis adenylyltransferase